MQTKTIKYLARFFCIGAMFFWIGFLCGICRAHYQFDKEAEKYRIEMVKDSLYYEFVKTQNYDNRTAK